MLMRVEEWLGEDNKIGLDIWHKKYQHGNETFDEWLDRVSGGDNDLRELIKSKKFLFGGRVLANRGVPDSGNFYNCFSAGYVKDDYASIMDVLKEVGITFKYQGGQGISMSKLRPKGTKIGDNYESDGIVPFIEMFNSVTKGTSQGGARKGALMISLDINHKEAETFIKLKTDLDAVTKANLSMEIDDEFMTAVQEFYYDGTIKTLHKRYNYNGHVVEYDITPIELYKLMMEVVWDYGEPGCIFVDEFRNNNFLEFDDEYQIETCNPCGEQPLKARTSCLLGSLNLYEFVENKFTSDAYFNGEEFVKAIKVASNALDNIIEENAPRLPKELEQYKQNAYDWRNMGLGVFNYAHMLMAMGLKYGSEEALAFTDTLFYTMMVEAIISNDERGKEKGNYPKFKGGLVQKSTMFRNHAPEELLQNGALHARNCTLLSIAPNGSISTMVGGSGGAEPEFALSYTRRTDNLDESYKIESNIVKEYRRITGNIGELPDYFVSSADIHWRDRVKTQSVIQKHIDTAISSTVNLPKETTKEEIEELYLYAWICGLKGITIFRDGCKRLGILTTQEDEATQSEKPKSELTRGTILSVSDDLIGAKRKLNTGCGSLHFEVYFDEVTGEPLETFVNVGSSGGCEKNLQFISRLISLALRAGVSIEDIIDQCKSIKPCPAYVSRTNKKHDTSKGSSCPSAIGYALEDLYDKIKERCFADFDLEDGYVEPLTISSPTIKESDKVVKTGADGQMIIKNSDCICPECGEPLVFEGGCNQCKACGLYNKCD